MRKFLIPLALIAAAPAAAQSSDADFLTTLLQDSLSGAGRQVVVTGFAGALSSRAQIDLLTIADDQGVWISLKDIVLDWQRSDLLLGRLTINTLSAAEIDLMRMPISKSEVTAEATAFSLPELPVAINIGSVSTPKLMLGDPVLGQPLTAQIDAQLSLEGGTGTGALRLQRTDADAPSGSADIAVSYSNAARALSIDVQAAEAAGGVLSQVLGIPAAPALELSIAGSGPIDSFAARLDLRSNGAQRLSGDVTLSGQTNSAGLPETGFVAAFSGDLAPLFQPQFRPFFGSETQLSLQGSTKAAGGFAVTDLALSSQAMDITGALDVDASGLPQRFALQGTLRDASGAPLVLPLALDTPAAIAQATISASFDAEKGDEWAARATLQGWQQSDLRIAMTEVAATGTLARAVQGTADGTAGNTNGNMAQGASFLADITYSAEGVQPARMSTARALGSVIWGGGRLEWAQGTGVLTVPQLGINGEDYGLSVQGSLDGLASGFAFSGVVQAQASNLARFSDLMGRPMSGAAKASYTGSAEALSGAFDGAFAVETVDLALGLASLDTMLQGQSSIDLSASRGADGVDLRRLQVQSAGLTLDVAGRIGQSSSDVSGSFALRDQPLAARGFGGAGTGTLQMRGPLRSATFDIAAQTQGLTLADPRLNAITSGPSDLTAQLRLTDLVPRLMFANLTSPQITAQIAQQTSGVFELGAELANLGVLIPEFPGLLSVSGSALPIDDGADLDLRLSGPAGLQASIIGRVSAGQSNDLKLSGQANAGVINAFIAPRSLAGASTFDLALRGPLALASLTGRVTLAEGRLADPALPFAVQAIAGQADLAGGRADIDLRGRSSHGGMVAITGNAGLQTPFEGDLQITLREFGLRDPDLYETTATGSLNYTGVLGAGARVSGTIDLGRTEVQLRPTDVVADTSLPDMVHLAEPARVRETRSHAGLLDVQTAKAQGAPIEMDITVRAPNRLFLRGRGLDAELGGELRLLGTTADVRPSGAFDLVQGRFEVLGKRLDLEEVRLELQGQLVPYLSLRAVNLRADVVTTVIIDGPAIDPEIRFLSSPEMPQEEVVAQLLFDQNLQGITTLQAVQMASAVATLVGRGDGIVARIRERMKLDNLDVQTDDAGTTELKMGKYVSDTVYSELSVDSQGNQALDFSLDVTRNLRLRAGAGSTGNVGIGVELETNY